MKQMSMKNGLKTLKFSGYGYGTDLSNTIPKYNVMLVLLQVILFRRRIDVKDHAIQSRQHKAEYPKVFNMFVRKTNADRRRQYFGFDPFM
jgi:hypothetical protein